MKKVSVIAILLGMLMGTFIILTLNGVVAIQKQQEDTLNQIMDIRREIDDLKGIMQVSAQPVQSDGNAVTADTLDLIERVVAAEARGDTLEGKMAVAQTIKDRGDLWDMPYKDVVNAPGQFASPYKGMISDDVALAVDLVFNQGCRVSSEPITHFYAPEAASEPYWTENKISRGKIGAHKFYY